MMATMVGHLMKGKSCVLPRQLSIFCVPIRRTTALTVVVTGEAVNGGDGEGMQVPCTLHFKGHQKFLEILKKELSGKA